MPGEYDATRIHPPAEQSARSAGGDLSDAELVLAARQSSDAFEQLYQRYADRLYRYAAGLTGSTSTADDIVSDTLLAAFEQIERFDPTRGSVAGWLFTIARRRVADEQRRLSRLRRALSRHGPETGQEDDLLSGVIRSEAAANVRAAFMRLPQNDREVLLLRFVADLSGPDIAVVLKLSPGAVRVRIHRALDRLSSQLGDEDGRV